MGFTGPTPGDALRNQRLSTGKTAKAVANEAGFSASYLSELETGKRPVSRSAVDRLAGPLGIKNAEEFWQINVVRFSQLNEGADPYRVLAGNPSRGALLGDTADYYALALELLKKLEYSEVALIVRRFTEDGLRGDPSGIPKARAILNLLDQSHPESPQASQSKNADPSEK